jgi:hypothetical protein
VRAPEVETAATPVPTQSWLPIALDLLGQASRAADAAATVLRDPDSLPIEQSESPGYLLPSAHRLLLASPPPEHNPQRTPVRSRRSSAAERRRPLTPGRTTPPARPHWSNPRAPVVPGRSPSVTTPRELSGPNRQTPLSIRAALAALQATVSSPFAL